MLTAYADESSDAKGERIFAVAGVMGTQEEWDALEIDWVRQTGGKIFHATDCESGYGNYKGISEEKRHREYESLTKILARTRMLGFGAIINIKDFKASGRFDLRDAPYFECFVSVVLRFVKLARIYIPKQQIVKFVFDINHNVRHNASYLYEEYLVKRKQYKEYTSYMDRKMGFATSEKIGIQVADLFSHEAMKYCDNLYFAENKKYTRKSINELFNTQRFQLRYYDKNDFNKFIEKYDSLHSLNQEEYENWLSKYRRNDNARNRIDYIIYLEAIKNIDLSLLLDNPN